MKRYSKILAMALTLAVIILAAGCGPKTETGANGSQTDADKVTIGIIQYAEHVARDAAREGFIDSLKDQGYVEGENVVYDLQNAQGDQSNLSTISDRFISNKVDLVLAIATPAAQAIAGKTSEIPILGTAITDYVEARLVDSNEKPCKYVTGTSDMNPI